jgi:hypothetical protein
MLFFAILIAAFLGKMTRGCLKYAILAGLISWVAYKDPVLADKFSQLFHEAWGALREFLLGL